MLDAHLLKTGFDEVAVAKNASVGLDLVLGCIDFHRVSRSGIRVAA